MAQETGTTPRGPDAARAELERTRARMSDTLDEIEDVLLRKKLEIEQKLDVMARVREKPLHAAGIVLGAGFLIGFLTGGKRKPDTGSLAADARSALWESRARRLLRIAREQELEIEELEADLDEEARRALASAHWRHRDSIAADDDDIDDDGNDDFDDEPSRFDDLKDAVRQRASRLIEEAGEAIVQNLRRRL